MSHHAELSNIFTNPTTINDLRRWAEAEETAEAAALASQGVPHIIAVSQPNRVVGVDPAIPGGDFSALLVANARRDLAEEERLEIEGMARRAQSSLEDLIRPIIRILEGRATSSPWYQEAQAIARGQSIVDVRYRPFCWLSDGAADLTANDLSAESTCCTRLYPCCDQLVWRSDELTVRQSDFRTRSALVDTLMRLLKEVIALIVERKDWEPLPDDIPVFDLDASLPWSEDGEREYIFHVFGLIRGFSSDYRRINPLIPWNVRLFEKVLPGGSIWHARADTNKQSWNIGMEIPQALTGKTSTKIALASGSEDRYLEL